MPWKISWDRPRKRTRRRHRSVAKAFERGVFTGRRNPGYRRKRSVAKTLSRALFGEWRRRVCRILRDPLKGSQDPLWSVCWRLLIHWEGQADPGCGRVVRAPRRMTRAQWAVSCASPRRGDFLAKMVEGTLGLEQLQSCIGSVCESIREQSEHDWTTAEGAGKHSAKTRRHHELDRIAVHYTMQAQRRGLSDEFTRSIEYARTLKKARCD